MGLKAVLDSLEGVDESLHDSYEQKQDGKYYLQVDGVNGLPEVAGLKKNRDSLLTEKKEIQEQLQKYEGVDPEKYAELVERQEELDAREAKDSGDWEAREQQMKDKHQEELDRKDQKIESLRSSLDTEVLESKAKDAIAEHGGNQKLLLPHVLAQARVAENGDGKHYPEVVDANGNPRISDGQGNPMTLDELVGEMKADVDTYGAAFKSSGNSGSGADPDAEGGGGGGGPKKTISWDEAEGGKELEAIAKGEVKVAE